MISLRLMSGERPDAATICPATRVTTPTIRPTKIAPIGPEPVWYARAPGHAGHERKRVDRERERLRKAYAAANVIHLSAACHPAMEPAK
jgi:hypothetical protein